MKGIAKRAATIILALAVIFTFTPFVGGVTGGEAGVQKTYAADDPRTPITEVVATSNIKTPVYGEPIPDPEIEVTTGSPVYFREPEWLKKTDDDWEIVTGGTFTAGTYKISAMLRIDTGGDQFIIGWPITVTVDGQAWTTGWPEPEVYPTWSRLGIGGPEYVVEEPPEAPLVFNDSSSFNIPVHYVSDPISAYSVAGNVSGGKEPYVFSKTSGPDWISVSSDGTVSGTPTEPGDNDDLIIRVTDSNSDYREITVDVGRTRMRPEDRTAITEVVATSDIGIPSYGAAVVDPEITVTEGEPAYFREPEWYKKTGDEWKAVTDSTFTEGTYMVSAMLRIDNGEEYILGSPLSVMVDGQEWTSGWNGPEVHPTFSRIGIGSPEFIIQKPTASGGWVKAGSYWYFFNANGTMAKSAWKKDSKGWCWLQEDGRMLTNGWAKDSKGWCWIGPNGYMVEKTQWIKVDGGWYHITNGYRDQNKWMKDSKGWCYLGSDGKMVTNGWAKDSKGWCWMGADGYWVSNKWVQDNGEWYYIKSNHYMAANEWAKDSGGWMYMNASGKITKNKWVKDGGYWYYLNADGYMATGTQVIDGKTYRFDSSGRWIQ